MSLLRGAISGEVGEYSKIKGMAAVRAGAGLRLVENFSQKFGKVAALSYRARSRYVPAVRQGSAHTAGKLRDLPATLNVVPDNSHEVWCKLSLSLIIIF